MSVKSDVAEMVGNIVLMADQSLVYIDFRNADRGVKLERAVGVVMR